jgi:hypothetical protein
VRRRSGIERLPSARPTGPDKSDGILTTANRLPRRSKPLATRHPPTKTASICLKPMPEPPGVKGLVRYSQSVQFPFSDMHL